MIPPSETRNVIRAERGRGKAFWLPFLLVTVLFAPSLRAASPDEQAAAQALFEEGLKLLDAGKAADACPKLEESNRLDAATATKFQLGRCYEAIGKTASAWALYLEVADTARRVHNGRAEEIARGRALALEQRLARLSIRVETQTSGLSGLSVQRDGIAIGPGMFGVAIPVDPGRHSIVANANGRRPWHVEIDVPKGPAQRDVLVPELTVEPLAPAGPAATTSAPTATISAGTSATAPRNRQNGPIRSTAWVGIGLGAAGAITGAVLTAIAKGSYDGTTGQCGQSIGAERDDLCTPDAANKRNSAVSQANAGMWLSAGGLALAAAGTVMLLTFRADDGGTPSARVGVGASGLWVSGGF